VGRSAQSTDGERSPWAKAVRFVAERPLLIPAAIAAALLIGATGHRPHWYFNLLRWVVCAVAVAFAIYASYTNRTWAGWVFGALAVLFNPVVPVHLARATWRPIDAAAGFAFGVGAALLTAAPGRQPTGPLAADPSGTGSATAPHHHQRSGEPCQRCDVL
jgi:hypothetical protein